MLDEIFFQTVKFQVFLTLTFIVVNYFQSLYIRNWAPNQLFVNFTKPNNPVWPNQSSLFCLFHFGIYSLCKLVLYKFRQSQFQFTSLLLHTILHSLFILIFYIQSSIHYPKLVLFNLLFLNHPNIIHSILHLIFLLIFIHSIFHLSFILIFIY